MRKISIGNDFRIEWSLKQLGADFNIVDKTYEIEVSCPYGIILVDDIIANGNTLSFRVPAKQQIYAGVYGIKLKISDENTNNHWALTQCNAFALVACCDCCDDVVEVVQLESNIVYPANGLNAYQMAVLDGYTGTYDEWMGVLSSITPIDIVVRANMGQGIESQQYTLAKVEYRKSDYGSYPYSDVGSWDSIAEEIEEQEV